MKALQKQNLQKIKNQKLMEFYGQVETIDGKSNNIGTYEVFFGDYKKMFDAPDNYNKVTLKMFKMSLKNIFQKAIEQ